MANKSPFIALGLLLTMPFLAALDYYGAGVHLTFGRGDIDQVSALLRQAGFNSVRDEYNWSTVESEVGVRQPTAYLSELVAAAYRNGLTPLLMLGYGHWGYDNGDYPRSPTAVDAYADFARTVAAATAAQPLLLQVWNEWDGGTGMRSELAGTGDAPSYLKLLERTYPAIRAAAPDATVLSNAYTKWQNFAAALELGLTNYCDGAVIHTYNYFHGPQANAEDWENMLLSSTLPWLERAPGRAVPLYITEMGWPTSLGPKGRTEEDAAAQQVRLWLLAQRHPRLKGLWLYDFVNDGWNPHEDEENFGLVRADLTPKQPFYAVRGIVELLGDAEFVDEIPTGRQGIHLWRFRQPDGRWSLVMWSSYPNDDWQMDLSRAPGAETVTLTQPGYPGYPRTWSGTLSLTLGALPTVLTTATLPTAITGLRRYPRPHSTSNAPARLQLPRFCLLVTPAAQPPNYRELPLQEVWRGDKGWHGVADLQVFYAVSYQPDGLLWRFKITDDHLQRGAVSDRIELKVRHPRAGDDPGNYLEFTFDYRNQSPGITVEYSGFALTAVPQFQRDDVEVRLWIPAAALGVAELRRGDVLEACPRVRDFDAARADLFTIANYGTGEYQYLVLQ